jgi:hypothetical protein
MVALLILGKKCVNMNNINAFFHPLVDELMMFWRLGVQAMDFGKPKGRCSFTFHGMVTWTINDFSSYGLLSRCVHQGYISCPKCGPQTTSQHSNCLRKLVYIGHHRWLWHRHPYQLLRFNNAFDGQEKERGEPHVVMGNEVITRGMEYQWWIGKGINWGLPMTLRRSMGWSGVLF